MRVWVYKDSRGRIHLVLNPTNGKESWELLGYTYLPLTTETLYQAKGVEDDAR